MRVARVEPIPVRYPEPNDHGATRHLCLVKITTDDGAVGWGEAITQFEEASIATAAIVRGMADLIIGRDPVHTSALWRTLKQHAWWYGHGGGIASYAIAAIDIALWDVKGIALNRSVLDLLGGPMHERIPAIASCHASKAAIPDMVDEAVGWLSTGLHGLKVGFGKRGDARLGYEHDRDVAYVKAMRNGLGTGKRLMIDVGAALTWDVATAVTRTRAFEDYGVEWVEEPLGGWDPAGYADLRAKTEMLIAYGEREWTLEGYGRILDTGTVDVVGVDPARAEGISGFRLVADQVEANRRQINAHAWSSAICTAASLALSFSTPAAKVFEFKPLANPMQHELVGNPIAHEDGWVYPPTRPGLGLDVNEDVVDHYRLDRQ